MRLNMPSFRIYPQHQPDTTLAVHRLFYLLVFLKIMDGGYHTLLCVAFIYLMLLVRVR